MLDRPARSRALVAAGVLLAAGLGSVLAGGTSSATSPARLTYGPVALPQVRPLLATDGPLLGRAGAWQRAPAPAAPMGPRAAAAELGPPPLVGPDSPPYRVRVVQRLLNAAGADLRVDGDWGPATTRAVAAVQARAGLPVTGRVGPATAHLLRR